MPEAPRQRFLKNASHIIAKSERVALLVAMYAYRDAPVYGITLDEEKAFVDRLVAPERDRGSVVSFGAEEIYVLSERRSPQPFLRLDRFVPLPPSGRPRRL